MLTSLPRSQRLQLTLAAKMPWVMRSIFGTYLRFAKKLTPDAVREKLERELPPSERLHLSTPGFAEELLADTLESGRKGPGTIPLELALIARPWGFPLEEITVPVTIWQGTEDANVTKEMGTYLAETMPDCEATFFPGEGHLVGLTHWKEILQSVLKPTDEGRNQA